MAAVTRFLFAPLLLLSLLVIASATAEYGYNVPKPTVEKPNPHGLDTIFDKVFGVQGFVYCKQLGSKPCPIEGAKVRITCVAENAEGYETAPFSVLSNPTDAKGYFFASLCPYEVAKEEKKLKECKVFLESSPLDSCDDPTDENNGLTGCPLTSFNRLVNKKMKLYSLPKPLYYTSHPKGY